MSGLTAPRWRDPNVIDVDVKDVTAPADGWGNALTGLNAWSQKNKGGLGKAGLGLGALATLYGGAQALGNPEESKLSNAVGAAGNVTGGLAALAAAAKFIPHPGLRMAGMALLPFVGAGAGEGIARAGVSLFEDPSAKALRDARRQAELQIEMEKMKSEELLPIRLKEAQIAQQLEERKLRAAAAVESQLGLQRAMAQGILQRDSNQTAQDIAMTNAVINGIFG